MTSELYKSYGVLSQNHIASVRDVIVEQVRILGFSILQPNLPAVIHENISAAFDNCLISYHSKFGYEYLKSVDEHNTIRCMLAHSDPIIKSLASNQILLDVISELIFGKFYLNQQNGIVNPPLQDYNQGQWHRDLPYQHFTSSRPLVVNALYCVDDFTIENGATHVLPGSHKFEQFPSSEFIKTKSIQITAKAGSFIILDGMLFHKGGINSTNTPRRAINHVFSIPHIRQQINFSSMIDTSSLNEIEKSLFGFPYKEYSSISEFFDRRHHGR